MSQARMDPMAATRASYMAGTRASYDAVAGAYAEAMSDELRIMGGKYTRSHDRIAEPWLR